MKKKRFYATLSFRASEEFERLTGVYVDSEDEADMYFMVHYPTIYKMEETKIELRKM
jgi:hypothetical protein